jgi:hypothetical protein
MVSLRLVRVGVACFFLLFVVAVTWPGMVPFNRIHPLVLGLPFSMVWIALWVALSFVVFLLVDRVEGRTRGTGSALTGMNAGEGADGAGEGADDAGEEAKRNERPPGSARPGDQEAGAEGRAG